MRSMISLLVLFLAGTTGVFACGMIPAPSTIRTVTVFRDRAKVERTATLNVPEGENIVQLRGLTGLLDDESVRIGGAGTADAAIVEVNVQSEFLSESAAEEVKELQGMLDSLNDETRRLADRAGVINTQRDFILALKSPATPGGPAPAKLNVKEFSDLMTYISHSLADFADQLRTIERTKSKIKDRMEVVNRRLAEIHSQDSKKMKQIAVRINARQAGTLNLEFSYLVDGASWEPMYDARVTTASGALSWTYYGVVRQETGENWTNVKLALSTSIPSQGASIPTLAAVFLHPYEPVVYGNGYNGSAMRMKASTMEFDQLAPAAATDSQNRVGIGGSRALRNSEVIVDDQTLSTTFTVDAVMDIPSDNTTHKATITTAQLQATLEHVTVPRMTHDVFLRARAANTSGVPFLSGPVSIFVDNQYVATTAIPTLGQNDSLQIALGKNDAIHVDRRLVNKVQEYNGMISKTYKWNYEYLTTVTNNAKSDVTIDVNDLLPLSQNEKILIETQSILPAAMEKSDANVMTWHWSLKPGEKREIRLKYSVEYPRDMRVAGLE